MHGLIACSAPMGPGPPLGVPGRCRYSTPSPRDRGAPPGNRSLRRRDRPAFQEVADRLHDAARGDPPLAAAIAVAEGDRPVGGRLAVDGDAQRRPRLVLPAVSAADRPLLIQEDV